MSKCNIERKNQKFSTNITIQRLHILEKAWGIENYSSYGKFELRRHSSYRSSSYGNSTVVSAMIGNSKKSVDTQKQWTKFISPLIIIQKNFFRILC